MVEQESVAEVTRKTSLSKVLVAFSGLIGGIVVVVTSLISLITSFHTEPKIEVHNVQFKNELRDVRADILQLKAEFKGISDSIQNISKLPDEAKLSIKLQQIIKSVADIQNREESLEKAILVNPSKALLEMPLIQRDLENFKVIQQDDIASIKGDVERTPK